MKKRFKNKLPVLDSNHDFLAAFEKKAGEKSAGPDEKDQNFMAQNPKNRHGVPVLDDVPVRQDSVRATPDGENAGTEDFALLLEESFKQKTALSVKKKSAMPVKKRIKRYPPVELELDLHGYTAVGAQVRTRSFILSSRERGYFTVRIIVGKGLHSDLGPVLPDVVEDVLREMKKQRQVIGYEWDKKKKSTSGAVIVFIKHFEQFE